MSTIEDRLDGILAGKIEVVPETVPPDAILNEWTTDSLAKAELTAAVRGEFDVKDNGRDAIGDGR